MPPYLLLLWPSACLCSCTWLRAGDGLTTEEGRFKEQNAIDQRGGVNNLDNKRNEVNQQKMQELKKKYDQ